MLLLLLASFVRSSAFERRREKKKNSKQQQIGNIRFVHFHRYWRNGESYEITRLLSRRFLSSLEANGNIESVRLEIDFYRQQNNVKIDCKFLCYRELAKVLSTIITYLSAELYDRLFEDRKEIICLIEKVTFNFIVSYLYSLSYSVFDRHIVIRNRHATTFDSSHVYKQTDIVRSRASSFGDREATSGGLTWNWNCTVDEMALKPKKCRRSRQRDSKLETATLIRFFLLIVPFDFFTDSNCLVTIVINFYRPETLLYTAITEVNYIHTHLYVYEHSVGNVRSRKWICASCDKKLNRTRFA